MSTYVLIALDSDYRVRECVPVSDLKTAQDLYALLRTLYDGDKVAMLSREVDDIPQNLIDGMMGGQFADDNDAP